MADVNVDEVAKLADKSTEDKMDDTENINPSLSNNEEKMDCTNSEEIVSENDSNETQQKTENAAVEEKPKNDGFLSPMSLPPIAKTVKKTGESSQKRSPVTMAFRSKFAIPADIYKAPKVAAFMTERMPIISKKEKETTEVNEEQKEESTSSEKPVSSKPKPPQVTLSYEPPDWSSDPDDDQYSFEVLKMGSIVDKVELTGKDHFLVGRLPNCDIKMDHPSISRYHAVLQFGAPEPESANVELQKDGSSGFYVYDLGSTHCTTVNKHTIAPKTYYRIKVGHVVKFGGSTRLFIMQGPSDDQEEETKETATELREFNKQKIKKKKDLERMMLGEDSSSDEEDGEKKKRKNNQKEDNNSGITWGMLEDAVESSSDEEQDVEDEEGDTRADHPDAVLVQTKKDAFYVKDPVKAIKNLYEREKMEPDYECNERRSGHWHIRLSLPVDGPGGKPVYSEINATGKKKDAIRQCALEACRVLERHGLFRNKGHQKQNLKKWEDDDFYDSDEDEFHDRTGELEHKRNLRMQRIKKSSNASKFVETYETLVEKVTALANEVKDIEEKLAKDRAVTKVNSDAVDPLDAFMQQVKSGTALDTTTRAKLKRRLFDAKKEHMRVLKLAEVARPSSMPPLASSTTKSYSFIGKMKGKKKAVLTNVRPVIEPVILEQGKEDENVVEEEDEETNKIQHSPPKPIKTVKLMEVTSSSAKNIVPAVPLQKLDIQTEIKNVENKKTESVKTDEIHIIPQSEETNGESDNKPKPVYSKECLKIDKSEKANRKRLLGPTLPPELKEQLIAEQDKPVDPENFEESTSKPKRKRQRVRKPKQSTQPNYSDDPNYSVWLPPENQTGDGKTSLNEKLGY